MKNLRYFDGHNTPHALANLEPYIRRSCSLIDVLDAVEDAKTAADLTGSLSWIISRVDLVRDRVTDRYVRLKYEDHLGNTYYIRAEF